MNWTRHASERVKFLLRGVVSPAEVQSAVARKGQHFERETHIIVKRLKKHVFVEGRNGDTIVAVVNGENIVTVMLRRFEQVRRDNRWAP